MALRLSARRRTVGRQDDPIVPMIDVVFFLLVFFMLVGRFDANTPFEVVPPDSRGLGQDMPGTGITVSVSANGALALDGERADRGAILAAVTERPDALIRLNAHHATPLGVLFPLSDALQEAGAERIVLVVTPARP